MKNLKKLIALTLVLTTFVSVFGCGKNNKGDKKLDYSDFTNEALIANSDDTVSTLTSLLTTGYVADTVNKNISDWLLEAYEKNPGIIDCITDHSLTTAQSFGDLVHDGWNMAANGISSVSISEDSKKYGRSIIWTNHKNGQFTDIDFAFGNSTSVTDWRGYTSLWVYIDVSGYGTNEVPVGIAFEEYDITDNGNVSSDRETWGLKEGGTVKLYSENGNKSEINIVRSKTAINDNRGRVNVPAKFKGWLNIDLSESVMKAYWSYPKANGKLDLINVHQFVINIEGTATSAEKNACIGPFMLSRENVKEAPSSLSDKNFTNQWPLAMLRNTMGTENDNIVFVFYGEFPGKLLTSMAYAYLNSPSDKLKQAADELTDALAEAQYEDGYLGLFDGTQRFGGGMNWDTWAQYHVLFGLLQWYKVSGNQKAYDTMIKSADYIMQFFKDNNRRYSYGTPMCNLGIAHAFTLIYLENGEKKYLDEAEKIVERDWKDCGDWLNNSEKGLEFYEMKNNYGNRWEPLHSVMTLYTLYKATGKERYRTAFEYLYNSILKTDRHNTGSFSVGEEACGDLYSMANGIETCCSVAWMALTTDYLTLTHDSKAADEAELSYYNTMLASLTENCRDVAYNTPMDGKLVKSQVDLAFQTRDFSPDFSCCQANSGRGLNQISQWAVLNYGNIVYYNWYGESSAHIKSPSGKELVITQNTEYPKNGNIKVTIEKLKTPEKFTLMLRVPYWANSFTVKIGDTETVYTAEKCGTYLPITGTWQEGMTLDIEIGMSFHYLVGKNDCNGKTAVYYGPILLALDSNYGEMGLLESFAAADIEKAELCNDENLLLAFNIVTSKNNTVKLISFADVGANGSKYKSWLKVTGEIEDIDFSLDGKPIWCAMSKR